MPVAKEIPESSAPNTRACEPVIGSDIGGIFISVDI